MSHPNSTLTLPIEWVRTVTSDWKPEVLPGPRLRRGHARRMQASERYSRPITQT